MILRRIKKMGCQISSAAVSIACVQPAVAEEAAAAFTPPNHPFTVAFDKISAGDTAWMLSATALVLLMTIPGLALFYAGMVRKKNVLSTALQSFFTCCLVTVLWVVAGYSLAFTPGSPLSSRWMRNITSEAESFTRALPQMSRWFGLAGSNRYPVILVLFRWKLFSWST